MGLSKVRRPEEGGTTMARKRHKTNLLDQGRKEASVVLKATAVMVGNQGRRTGFLCRKREGAIYLMCDFVTWASLAKILGLLAAVRQLSWPNFRIVLGLGMYETFG